jgi:CRISPR-associated exonuclease Cas4
MESYIPISKINDFAFCPVCAYLHFVYQPFNQQTYHQTPQVAGKIKHEAIDKKAYSSAKRYIAGLDVYSAQYGLAGKIDIYDSKEKKLIERKNKIKVIYDGYRYQMYAQYYCLQEMGFEVQHLAFHSMSDNKTYTLAVPSKQDKQEFEQVLAQLRAFDINKIKNHTCDKCANSIYASLAW